MSKQALVPVLLAILALVGAEAAGASGKYRLPDGPGQPVITLDFQGGRLRRIDDAPTLAIFADGRVVMPKLYAHSVAREGKITQARLQALLDLIIVEGKFFQYDAKRVDAKLAAMPGRPRVLPLHLATTELVVHANGQRKAVAAFGLGHQVLVEETEALLTIRRKLEQLMSTIILGGDSEVAAWLAVANGALATEQPSAAPLVADDLESGTVRSDGSVFVRFVRGGGTAPVAVTLSIAADGRRGVTVSPHHVLAGAAAPGEH